jgi:choline dehydrogenase-like flavoprotein
MYDTIIVGAGSAGCVLAGRLSADSGRRVCLIEAGPADRSPALRVPLGLAVLARGRRYNWAYETVPQPELGDRRLYWPRGRTLGGSSAINAMIYMRGHPDDYEGWARAAGPRWSWARVRALFIRMEANDTLAGPHHGTDGPLAVCDLRHVNPLSRAFVEAAQECQLPANRDFNGARQEGAGLYQVTQRDGRRWSAARAFLDPARDRANLTILTEAQVQRVRIERRRATGVVLRDRTIDLAEGGEVILACGAVGSPHLLMLSGVGPARALAGHGIETVHDAPEVGGNLADHLDIAVVAAARGREAIGLAPSFLPRALRGAWAYARHRTGEYTSNIAEAGGFARSGPERDRPNLQFHFLPAFLNDHGRRLTWGYGITLHVCDLLPRSRGRISLASPDPQTAPLIDPNYLADPADGETLLAGLRLARRIVAAPALARHLRAEILPGARTRLEAELLADIRARAETVYHPVGTCRMGRDDRSVVDPEARVRGVGGLRVADASIMPSIIAGNTNAATMMIAQNVADMILG